MKILSLIISSAILCPVICQASEIFGTISTDPGNMDRHENNREEARGPAVSTEPAPTPILDIGPKGRGQDPGKNNRIRVLGDIHYPEGSLLRGSDLRVYVLIGKCKKHILNLAELRNYTGREILDVPDQLLERYQTRRFFNGDLIRQKGREEIYIIENESKRHISSLEELRKHYFGREIHPVSREEIREY